MWRKKKWIIVSIVAATIILLAGIIGGVAYAQSSTTPTTTQTPVETGKKTIMTRVAEILGIDEQKLKDAFKQAQKEQIDQALSDRLNALVENGKLTKEQADQYKKWWESRPDVPAQLDDKGPMGMRGGFRCFPGPGGFRGPSTSQ